MALNPGSGATPLLSSTRDKVVPMGACRAMAEKLKSGEAFSAKGVTHKTALTPAEEVNKQQPYARITYISFLFNFVSMASCS